MSESAGTVILTACKGRLEHLREALQTWEPLHYPIVVVDSGCPDGTRDWLSRRHPQVKCVVDEHPWNKSWALNHGILFIAQKFVPLPRHILVLDADTRVRREEAGRLRDVVDHTLNCEGAIVSPGPLTRDLTGVLLAPTKTLLREGYDTGFVGWGWEDIDVRLRLHRAGVPFRRCLPVECFSPIEHGDELREQHQADTKAASAERNRQRLLRRIEDWGYDPANLTHDVARLLTIYDELSDKRRTGEK